MRSEFPDTFKIVYPSGSMELYYCSVFPAAKTWLNKLLKKVLALDYEHEKQILEEIAEYLEYNIARTESEKKPLANAAVNAKQKVSDLKRQIESRKRPNGLPISRGEVKDLKKDLASFKYDAQTAERLFNKNLKDNQRYKENLIVIRERLEAVR
jgi:hypothetical protein